MVLGTVKGSINIPEGAEKLTEKEAIEYQRKLFNSWSNPSEVFFIKHGKTISSCVSFATSAYISKRLRTSFNLQNRGVILSMLLVPINAAFFNYKLYDNVITNKILIMKAACPVCEQMKLCALQLYSGIISPVIFSLPLSTSIALLYNTCVIPNLKTNAIDFYKFWYKCVSSGGWFRYYQMAAFHVILAFGVTFLQSKEFLNVTQKIN